MNPFFTNVVLRRLRSSNSTEQPSTSTPRWAVAVTWVIVVAAVALVGWLVTEIVRGQVP